jgi:site-specific recombinase XerD
VATVQAAASVKGARNPLEKIIVEFLEYLEVERDVSPLTVRNYAHYLRRFTEWRSAHGWSEPAAITQEAVRQYRVYLSRLPSSPPSAKLDAKPTETLSKKTQGYHAIALRSFLKWLVRTDRPALAPQKVD